MDLKADPPDVIRDKDDLLNPFLDRIPELRNCIHRNGIYYTEQRSATDFTYTQACLPPSNDVFRNLFKNFFCCSQDLRTAQVCKQYLHHYVVLPRRQVLQSSKLQHVFPDVYWL